MGVDQEIKQANLERIKSIEYMCIEKSMSDDVGYGVKEGNNQFSGLSISKSGEEIKNKLSYELERVSKENQDNYTKMIVLVKQIAEAPIKESTNYQVRNWKGKIQVPLTYCYSQIYDESNQSDHQNAKLMREYNNLANECVSNSIEEKKLGTIINALDDKKKYKLTVDIASKLGF